MLRAPPALRRDHRSGPRPPRSLRSEYVARLYPLPPCPAAETEPCQLQLEKQFREKRDEEDFERSQRERAEAYERLHLLQLKQQQGEPIDPAEFSPAPKEAYIPRDPIGADKDDLETNEDDDDDHASSGGTAIPKPPTPPPTFFEDGIPHPLADNYRLSLTFTLTENWLEFRHAPLALHLLTREADEEIPKEPAE